MQQAERTYKNIRIEQATHARLKRLLDAGGHNFTTGIDVLSIYWQQAFVISMTEDEKKRWQGGTMQRDEMREIYQRVSQIPGPQIPPVRRKPLGDDERIEEFAVRLPTIPVANTTT
jgi:hypothetical protein